MRRFPVQIRVVITTGLLLVAVAVVILLRQQAVPFSGQPTAPAQMMTLDPVIVANLTALPNATPLSGQDANDMVALSALVEACDAYSPERKDQMLLQIQLVINPAAIPRDVVIALGANPRGRLLRALGEVTGIQWRLLDQPADSCLIPIGKRLNEFIAAAGETPVAAFEEVP